MDNGRAIEKEKNALIYTKSIDMIKLRLDVISIAQFSHISFLLTLQYLLFTWYPFLFFLCLTYLLPCLYLF